ncbi:MAG: hydrolase family protein [Nevskia sp.]|nr:hydrolase family protein [Nevskia sp.]
MNVKRIFCIGRNYAAHIEELGNAPDSDCVIFMKPPSCIVPVGQTVRLPRGAGSIHHEAELVIALSGGGANIAVEQALQHVSALTLGLDLTLRDLQSQLKDAGKPWELSKAFDDAAPLGTWVSYQQQDLQALEFTCSVNGEIRQRARTSDMLYSVARQIQILSRIWALSAGDIIFTGTPKGVGPLVAGDVIALESATTGRFEWRCS